MWTQNNIKEINNNKDYKTTYGKKKNIVIRKRIRNKRISLEGKENGEYMLIDTLSPSFFQGGGKTIWEAKEKLLSTKMWTLLNLKPEEKIYYQDV